MITVLVANMKGGAGKTTIATNLAAAYADSGLRTALADADRQRSSLRWAAARPETVGAITALDWSKGNDAVPAGTARLVVECVSPMWYWCRSFRRSSTRKRLPASSRS